MLFLRIISVIFIFLDLAISIILVKVLGLRKRGWNFADIAFPLFAFQFYLVSDRAYYHSLLPHLVLALSLLALGISLYFVFKRREFPYKKVLKFFWRAGFILTFLLYLALVIALFLMKG